MGMVKRTSLFALQFKKRENGRSSTILHPIIKTYFLAPKNLIQNVLPPTACQSCIHSIFLVGNEIQLLCILILQSTSQPNPNTCLQDHRDCLGSKQKVCQFHVSQTIIRLTPSVNKRLPSPAFHLKTRISKWPSK